jgi:hypothetical protein
VPRRTQRDVRAVRGTMRVEHHRRPAVPPALPRALPPRGRRTNEHVGGAVRREHLGQEPARYIMPPLHSLSPGRALVLWSRTRSKLTRPLCPALTGARVFAPSLSPCSHSSRVGALACGRRHAAVPRHPDRRRRAPGQGRQLVLVCQPCVRPHGTYTQRAPSLSLHAVPGPVLAHPHRAPTSVARRVWSRYPDKEEAKASLLESAFQAVKHRLGCVNALGTWQEVPCPYQLTEISGLRRNDTMATKFCATGQTGANGECNPNLRPIDTTPGAALARATHEFGGTGTPPRRWHAAPPHRSHHCMTAALLRRCIRLSRAPGHRR